MLTDKTIVELSDLLEKKEVSSVEIANEYLQKIEEKDKEINAFISIDKERSLSEADAADKRRAENQQLSVYDGVPIAIKDNINTKGMRTTCASKILENFVSPFDATSYEMLRSQGFVTLGKTNLDEFAMGSTTETSHFGPTKNPHDLSRVPGGSSGGSAAAVAAGMAPGALGSDTGGSIRQPASFCGVVGIKPTYGRVSRYGLVAFASSLDQIGTFGQTVDDAAAVLSVISGGDKRDTTSIDKPVDFAPDQLSDNVKGLVVGVPEEYFKNIDPETNERVTAQVQKLEENGVKIEPISLQYTEYAIPVYYLIATAEASSNLARYDGVRYGYRTPDFSNLSEMYNMTRSEGFGKEVKRRIILGTFSLSSGYYDAYYLKALKGRTLIIEDFKKAFDKVDAIITPVTTTPAVKLNELISDPLHMYMSDILTISVNLAGIPGISVPVGTNNNGLPIGLQIMGDHFQEKTILNLAKRVEQNCK